MSLHPLETVLLPALQNVRKTPARAGTIAAWRASCPLHDTKNKNNDLSIAISADDMPLLHCFCKHTPAEVFEFLGIDWTDLHPRSTNPGAAAAYAPSNGGPHEWAPVYSAGERCLFALERAFSLLAPQTTPECAAEYLRAILEAGEQLQNFKKFIRAAVRTGGGAK
jgi:hypothetical protein